jgi:hypothetical protein
MPGIAGKKDPSRRVRCEGQPLVSIALWRSSVSRFAHTDSPKCQTGNDTHHTVPYGTDPHINAFSRHFMPGYLHSVPSGQGGQIATKQLALSRYIGTYVPMSNVEIERIQTGVRLEKRLLKVLKAVAELKDMSLGDLLEGIVLHAFEGKAPFTRDTLKEIEQLKTIYGLTLTAEDSHNLKERP